MLRTCYEVVTIFFLRHQSNLKTKSSILIALLCGIPESDRNSNHKSLKPAIDLFCHRKISVRTGTAIPRGAQPRPRDDFPSTDKKRTGKSNTSPFQIRDESATSPFLIRNTGTCTLKLILMLSNTTQFSRNVVTLRNTFVMHTGI